MRVGSTGLRYWYYDDGVLAAPRRYGARASVVECGDAWGRHRVG